MTERKSEREGFGFPEFEFRLPTRIVFGRGSIHKLRESLDSEWRRILIATDRQVAELSGGMEALKAELDDRKVVVFDAVEPNPSFETVTRGAALAEESETQLVIGLGGGSPMDAAKGIAVVATNPGDLREYVKGRPLTRSPLPVVAIPTTSGTGSEVTPYGVFTDATTHTKNGYSHPGLFPRLAVLDPELTFSMPRAVVVYTGLDVLTHAIEAYLSTLASPMSDLIAIESVRLALDNLERAGEGDHQAMSAMAFASMLAGGAITQCSTVLLHVMGYPLTVDHGVPHGQATAVLLPAFLDWMERHSTVKSRIRVLRGLLTDRGGVVAFLNRLGVVPQLAPLGVRPEEIDSFVPKVIVKSDVALTPGPVTEAAIAEIYHSAM